MDEGSCEDNVLVCMPAAQIKAYYLSITPPLLRAHTHTHKHSLTIAQGLLCILSMGAVYFTVARGVTVGAIEVVNSTISFNTTAVRYGG